MPSSRGYARALTGLAALSLLAAVGAAPAQAATAHPVAHAGGGRAAQSASYPFAKGNPNTIDPWGAYERQCTSFASWALSHRGVRINGAGVLTGPKGTATLGDARTWDAAARSVGDRISSTPVVGAVAQWHANESSTWPVAGGTSFLRAGPTGHVAIVRKVLPHGEALLEDYNGATPLGRTEYVGKAPRYLLLMP